MSNDAAGVTPMALYVYEESGSVLGVWVENVPADLTDEDVRYSFERRTDDAVAAKALPYLTVCMCRPEPTTRVYLDD